MMNEKLSVNYETKEKVLEDVRKEFDLLENEINSPMNSERCMNRLLNKPKVNKNLTKTENKFIKSIEKKYDGPALYAGWKRIKRYLPQIYKDCAAENIPFEFAMIPMIESYFKSNAGAPNVAYGPWQFLKGTANEYGLKDRTSYVESSRAGVKYCAKLYNTLKDKYDLDSDNAFKFACLAYNTGLSKAQVFCKYFKGDFSKMLPYFKAGKYSGLKKAFADNNVAIKKAGGTAFQTFPSVTKIKEISEYAYKIPCFIKLLKKHEDGGVDAPIIEEPTQEIPENYVAESNETFKEGNITLESLSRTTAVLSSGEKNVTIYISKGNKLRYQIFGEEMKLASFNSENDFHTIPMKQILDESFGDGRTSAPQISRTILSSFYPDGITSVQREEEVVEEVVPISIQENEEISEEEIPGKKEIEVDYLAKDGAQLSSGEEIIMIFPNGNNSIDYFIEGRQNDGMKNVTFESKDDFRLIAMKQILDDGFGENRKSIPEEAKEIYTAFYQ